MRTFTRFFHAVKARPESLGVCGLTLLLACARSATPPASDIAVHPALAPPSRARVTAEPPAVASEPDAGSPLSLPDAAADAPVSSVRIDSPYAIDPQATPALPPDSPEASELMRWNVGGTSDPNYTSSQGSFHPGTRVVVDTRLNRRRAGAPSAAKHTLTAERVQAQARSNGYWPYRLCFEAGQREKKGLGGETRVAFTIGIHGKVSSARIVSTQLENRAIAGCFLQETRRLRFSPRPSKHLDVIASIRIWPGDVDQPAPATSSDPAPTITTSASFDPAAVSERVASKRAELDACFDSAQRADSALWGRLGLAVILEVDGSVHRVTEVESHFPNAGVTRCVEALVASLVFPSVAGKPFAFVLPLRFGSPDMARQIAEPASSEPSEEDSN